VGAATQNEALSGQLVAALARDYRVSWKLLARTGSTTPDALAWLRQLPRESFDVVVTSLGVNDVTANRHPARWLRDKSQLIELLRQEYGAALVLVSALPPMHRFPALPQPLRWYLGAQARDYNRLLQAWLASCPGCRLEAVEAPQYGEQLIASDGFHPGPGFYRLWAAQLAATVRRHGPAAGR